MRSLAPVSEAVYGTGTVEPERWAKVVPLQRRRLVEICRCEGQAVRAGQVLGRQDDAEERNALVQDWRSITSSSIAICARARRTDKNDAARTEIEQRETAFDQAKSRIAAQGARLDTLLLRAPIDGLVLRRDGEVGEIVGPTEVPFWVGQPTPLQVVAEINEEEIIKVAVGQKAFLRTEAFEGQALRADVSQITPKGDPTRKTFRVYLRLPQQTPLRIGMTVETNIIFREKQAAMVVPTEAIVANAVQTVDDGRIRRVPVKIGVKGSDRDHRRRLQAAGRHPVARTPPISQRTKVASSNSWTRRRRLDASETGRTSRAAAPCILPVPGPRGPGRRASRMMQRIAAAMSAHIESVVLDARRNVRKYISNRRG